MMKNKTRILIINPNTSEFVTEKIRTCVENMVGSNVEIVAVTGTRGAPIINTRSECAIGRVEALELAVSHAHNCDAVLLAISFDTGLDELREILPIPVVGMSEAGMLVACTVARRFSLVTFGERSVPLYEELIEHYRLKDRSVGTVTLRPLTQKEMIDPTQIIPLLIDKIEETAENQGAEAIVLAGAIFAGLAERLRDQVSIPVIDGIVAGISMLQLLDQLNLRKPQKGSYRFPDNKPLEGMSDAFRSRFRSFI